MEELLNKLIEKGWKPRGKDQKFEIWIEILPYKKLRLCLKKPDYNYYVYSYRELVSKESGLWQFVCENRMTKKMEKIPRGIWINSWHKSAYEKCPVYTMEKAEYRLIESALCNEEDLEDFLLKNIKI